MRYYVNGRFLTRRMTGVERYAAELLTALDRRLTERGGDGSEWCILTPPGELVTHLPLRTIQLRQGGTGSGHRWEQLSLPRLAADGKLLNPANSGPVRHRRSLTIIHDAIVYRKPELFSFPYRSLHRMMGLVLSRTSQLGTVSQFSRDELAAVLRVASDRICVVPNGSDHLGRVEPEPAVIERLGLSRGNFFLFVGSPAPHKNLARALDAYASLAMQNRPFVIVGAAQASVFGGQAKPLPPGAVATGRLTDGEIAALYANAGALVFPSLYEGFGIPPLEAMSHNCPVLASEIPPVREVCGDAVTYFDPLRVDDISRAMRELIEGTVPRPAPDRAAARLACFNWERSAEQLHERMERL